MKQDKSSFHSIVQAMGLVFGDIGTSPIYTLTVIFLTIKVNFENVVSILSMIIWTLILIVTIQYTFLAMSQSKRGEGGTIVLDEVLRKLLKSGRAVAFYTVLTYLGTSLLMGDSVITPAISILSAVEGLKLIPPLHNLPLFAMVIITILIAVVLFASQKHGTEKISKVFGPVMLIWFIALGLSGFFSVLHCPGITAAFNPLHAIKFIYHHGLAGFFVLSEVILCATGAESLYADMGQIGRKPITEAWAFILVVLVANYLGQGAFILAHPDTPNALFSMIVSQARFLYAPFLLISVLATIIASQAMISGMYSIVYQGINTHIFPLLKVDYTSEKINSQIYISSVNWFLLCFVIVMVLFFKQSSKLASAYGFAVTGTFCITITLLSTIFFLRKKYFHFLLSLGIGCMDVLYLIASFSKIPTGAYWSIIIAMLPLSLILIYVNGQKSMHKAIHLMDKPVFMEKYDRAYKNTNKIEGTALFFARGIEKVPPYIVQTMFTNNILYTDNYFVQISKTGEAFGIKYQLTNVAEGLNILKVDVGYMQTFKLENVLKKLKIEEKVIFYGVEDIETSNFIWHIFAIIKKVTPAFVSFYKMPSHKIHGVITKIKL